MQPNPPKPRTLKEQRREAMQPQRPTYPEPDPLPLKPLG